jgi:hypothetical protein
MTMITNSSSVPYLEFQKEEVLEMVWNVARSEIGVSGSSVPDKLKKLFPEIEKGDIFKMNIFRISTVKRGSSRVDLQACKLGTGRRFTTS